jgi:hypothetical protein
MKDSDEIQEKLAVRHSSIYGIKDITPQKNPTLRDANGVPTEFESLRNDLQQLRTEVNVSNQMLPGTVIKTLGLYILIIISFPISFPIIIFNEFGYHAAAPYPEEIELSDQQTEFEILKNDIELLRIENSNNNESLPGRLIRTFGLCILLLISFPISLPLIVLHKIVYTASIKFYF